MCSSWLFKPVFFLSHELYCVGGGEMREGGCGCRYMQVCWEGILQCRHMEVRGDVRIFPWSCLHILFLKQRLACTWSLLPQLDWQTGKPPGSAGFWACVALIGFYLGYGGAKSALCACAVSALSTESSIPKTTDFSLKTVGLWDGGESKSWHAYLCAWVMVHLPMHAHAEARADPGFLPLLLCLLGFFMQRTI